jgi:hypothetical protein
MEVVDETVFPFLRSLARFIHGLLRDQMMGGDHRVDLA